MAEKSFESKSPPYTFFDDSLFFPITMHQDQGGEELMKTELYPPKSLIDPVVLQALLAKIGISYNSFPPLFGIPEEREEALAKIKAYPPKSIIGSEFLKDITINFGQESTQQPSKDEQPPEAEPTP